MRKMIKYRDYLIEKLSDREEATVYLQTSIEEYQKDGNTPALLLALQSIIEAQRGRSELVLQVYLLRGLVYHSKKEYDAAIEDYTKVLELNPDYKGDDISLPDLLTSAFEEVQKLPEESRDALAEQLIEDIKANIQWDESLAKSPDVLAALADKAREEYRAGRTKQLKNF